MKFRYLILLMTAVIIACQTGEKGALESPVASVNDEQNELIQRGLDLELNTEAHKVPGNPESHHACGFAKVLCSAVFITGLDFDFAAEAIGYFSSPYEPRLEVKSRTLFSEEKKVEVALPDGTIRTAIYTGGQGCICLGEGEDALHFDPQPIVSQLPDPELTAWPIGDQLPGKYPENIDEEEIEKVLEIAFEPAGGLTAAMVITHKGAIIGERYKDEIDQNTSLESWSMGKKPDCHAHGNTYQSRYLQPGSTCTYPGVERR